MQLKPEVKSGLSEDWVLFKGKHSDVRLEHERLVRCVRGLNIRECHLEINPLSLKIEQLRDKCTDRGYCKENDIPVEQFMIDRMVELNKKS